MRVLVAPGSVGELSAPEVARIISDGWREAAPHVQVLTCAQVDGGPGTASVLSAVGRPGPATVATATMVDVAGAAVPAFADGECAWLDSVDAERAGGPGSATLGAAVGALVESGISRLVIGLSASPALDGGRGFIVALGGSADVDGLHRVRQRLAGVQLTAVAATDRQLLGFQGACYSAVEELGIAKEQAQAAEQAMGEWLDVLRAALPARRDLLSGTVIRPERLPGAGAGGGLGHLLSALGGNLVAGPDHSARATGLTEQIAAADLVVTATRVFDWRVLEHSVLAQVASAAGANAKPAVVLADEVHVGRREQMSLGLQGAYSVHRSGWMRPQAPSAAELADALAMLTRRVAGTWTPPPRADVP